MKKKYFVFILSALMLFTFQASALEPYYNYTYDDEANTWREPQAYYASRTIRGSDLGISPFLKPSDIFTADDKTIYICDSGNNRIVHISQAFSLIRTIEGFIKNGAQDKFNNPSGVFVSDDGTMYISDTDNGRIVILDKTGALVKIVGKPDFGIENDFKYAPIKTAVDKAGRIFVVSKNVNYGMIELDKNGNFTSFYGAIKVKSSLIGSFWKKIATQAQKAKMVQSVPTEYSSNAVDSEGFVYGTISTQSSETFVKKLNPLGNDIIRKMGSVLPSGDVSFEMNNKEVRSVLVDICLKDNGVYSVLDSRMGRIFTYNKDGVLMYVFGGISSDMGGFLQPAALDIITHDRFAVADSGYNQIVIFEPTEYARLINSAVVHQALREYDKAEATWLEVQKHTAKSVLAYNEIGKAYFRRGDSETAMKYFLITGNREQYSKAYKEYRRDLLKSNFDSIMTLTLILAVVIFVGFIIGKRLMKKRNNYI